MSESVAPLSEMSSEHLFEYLSELWEKQLKVENVEAQDDFLKLGGQSIDMFRMLTRIENDFDREIDFDAFFEDTRLEVLHKLLLNNKN